MLKLSIERTETTLPPPGGTVNPRLEIWRDVHGAVTAYAEILNEEYWMHLPGLASFRFSSCGDEIAAAVTSSVKEELVLDAYHRKVLPMALQVCGREVLHASAVRSPAGVIALCGTSETGKSTIAVGLSHRGYPLWADDAVAFDISERGGLAISLPFHMRLRESASILFDRNEKQTPIPSGNDNAPPGSATAPLVVVGVLRRSESVASAVSVLRLSSAQAFAAVFEHACCFTPQDPERKRRMIRNYFDLVAGIPIFDICFRPGLANLPAVLDAVEQVLSEATHQS